MNSEVQDLTAERWAEMQEKLDKLQNGVLLSPEEYGALLQLLAQKELEKQNMRMRRSS